LGTCRTWATASTATSGSQSRNAESVGEEERSGLRGVDHRERHASGEDDDGGQ
jgi:hypothetical protein